MRATADGLGIALENDLMAADFEVPRPASYYFVCPAENLLMPKVRTVRNWLREAFKASEALRRV